MYVNILKVENKFIAESIQKYLRDNKINFELKENNGFFIITAYCYHLFDAVERISSKWSDENLVYTISDNINIATYLYINGKISEIVSTNTDHYEESVFDDSLRGIIKVITVSKNGNEVASLRIAYIEKTKDSENNIPVYREIVNYELKITNQDEYDTLFFNINSNIEEFDKIAEYYGEYDSYSEYGPVVELKNKLNEEFKKGIFQPVSK